MGRRNSKPQFPATISNDHFQKEKIESPALFDTSSNNGFKKRALVNSLRTLKVVRQMGLEPIRSRTRTSNVPVCQFQHCRAKCIIRCGWRNVNHFFRFLQTFFKICGNRRLNGSRSQFCYSPTKFRISVTDALPVSSS